MPTSGARYPTAEARSARHESVPATFIAGAVTLLLLVLLAALVFVALWTARGAAKRAACTSQLRELAGAFAMYRSEYGDYPPGTREVRDRGSATTRTVTWEDMLRPYVGSDDVFYCPCDPSARPEGGGRTAGGGPERHPNSYQYARVESSPPPESGSSNESAERTARRGSTKQGATRGMLLVCRHHDNSGSRGRPRVLVAYEDGSVRWQSSPDFLSSRRVPPRVPQPGRNDW